MDMFNVIVCIKDTINNKYGSHLLILKIMSLLYFRLIFTMVPTKINFKFYYYSHGQCPIYIILLMKTVRTYQYLAINSFLNNSV